MKIGDLVSLREGSPPTIWAQGEALGNDALFLIVEDPDSEEVVADSGLFYILHPPSGLKIPVNALEIVVVAPWRGECRLAPRRDRE